MKLPLLLLALLISASAPALAGTPTPPKDDPPRIDLPPLPPVPGLRVGTDVEAPRPPATPPVADADMTALLQKIGWKPIENGGLISLQGPDKGYIPGSYVTKARFDWQNGKLVYKDAAPIGADVLPKALQGVWAFVSAAKTPPEEAGKLLAAWGVPPSVDGRKVVQPDGKATYYGQMLAWIYAAKPEAVKRASVQRLSQGLDKLTAAYQQAFFGQSADVALVTLDEAKKILFLPARPGETPLDAKPYQDLRAQIDGMRTKIQADIVDARGAKDEARLKESEAALATLNQLERQRYSGGLVLPPVPAPGAAPHPGSHHDSPDAPDAAAPYTPLASGLPGLLRALDRINGTPLTADQQENLIKSFPMGELVWRLGAQDLWRQGLTGKGVKVAVIDGGIAPHAELDASVDSRTNLTPARGTALNDVHGTHVAGIIHALAPDARINGYAVFDNASEPSMRENPEPLIRQAIDKAVADGNRIISMSLGGNGSPSSELARQVERYSNQGVIFIIAAGNERNQRAVEAPSVAPNALTVGSLDAAGRMSDYSSFGENFDARKLAYVAKTVFMLPGQNIVSTVPKSPYSFEAHPPPAYDAMSGTSMATPALSGITALLVQSASTVNPVALSGRIEQAYRQSSTPMSLESLPPNVPMDQQFVVVKPLAALDALRTLNAPATAGEPAKKKGQN